jgi:Helicase associated domain
LILQLCITSHRTLRWQFKAVHGHCNVPARYNENRKLGIFVSAQRSQYKALQLLEHGQSADTTRTSLTRERIRLLNDLGFSWTVRSQYLIGESWNQKLNELKLYREIHGQCNVPARYPENPSLGIWVRSGWQSCRACFSDILHSCTWWV